MQEGQTARLATLFNLPLAIAAGWLLWRSLDWPLVGDATIFHFIAGQVQMGAVPYRDIFDINMPLIYYIHAAVVAIGGMSDVAWRAFDLAAALLMSGLILMLVWPAGRAVAILAVLIVLVTHFLLGPYSAGQRDFLMSIPALAAALASARAAEDQEHGHFYLMLVGAFAMAAASIKPSGMLLLLLPVFASVERDWRAPLWVILGAAGIGILVFGTLAAWGGLEPFITTMQKMMPRYASLGARTVPEISEDVVVWLAPTAGLALAAVLNIPAPKPPRVRVMIGLTLFGLIHLLVQRKGWFYHVYPLGIGLACWGAWSLASLPPWRAAVCVLATAITPVWLAQEDAFIRTRMYHVLHSASAMQAALEDRLPRGARVQVLDSDYGAFLAMARAGMRQATPHIQWFSLVFAEDSVRHQFLAALEDNPPAAILLTNSQWPQPHGFDAADGWPKLAALLASRYVLDRAKNENGIAWRLYLRRASPA
jgi:Dolichyl-phosphate-mannose-protein mannosyltransferase